jgi:LPS-assembly protein
MFPAIGLAQELTGALNPPETLSALEEPDDQFAPWPENQEYPGPFPEEAFPGDFGQRASVPPSAASQPSESLYGADLSGLPSPGDRVRIVVDEVSPQVTIEANEARYDLDDSRIDFVGNVVITRGQEEISGERAIWHEPTMTAEISGEVKMRTPDFTASASRAAVNMDLKLAKLYDGKAFFPQGHYYVEGDVIERQGEETLYVNEAVFTTCDGPDPSWRLKAKNLMVNREGLATATGVTFVNKWFNLFYTPFFAVPVKKERQTGFLMPSVNNSTRDGFSLATPFFWELAEDYDLTLTPVWRSKRGLAMTAEARYNLSVGQGILLLTFLRDRQVNTFFYRSAGTNRRDIQNLYWLRAQNSWNVGGWNLNLDLDLVSDPMFLYSFRNDIDGFNSSKHLFTRYFGRTVNEELDPVRQSTFFAQKANDDSYLRGSLNYSNNLYLEGNVDTLQTLPSLQYDIVSRPVGLDGFSMPGSLGGPRFSLHLQYDYFTRKVNAQSFITETGHRLTVSPSIFWIHDLGDFMNLKVDAGGRGAFYLPRGERLSATGLEPHDSFESVVSGNINVELTTSLSRVYDLGPGKDTQTQHEVSPILAFELVRAPSQSEMPFFDTVDRRLSRQTFRYGLRNSFTTKTPVHDANGNLLYNEYQQIFKLGVYSSYEFANNIKWAEKAWARYYTIGYYDRGVGPFEFELESNLAESVTARLFSQLDGRSGKFTRHEISLNVRSQRGDYLGLIYDYDKPTLRQGPSQYNEVSQLRGDANINLTNGWSANFSSRYDFQRNKELESYLTLNYDSQCYSVSVFFASTYDDKRVGLVFDLLGLGSINTPKANVFSSGD